MTTSLLTAASHRTLRATGVTRDVLTQLVGSPVPLLVLGCGLLLSAVLAWLFIHGFASHGRHVLRPGCLVTVALLLQGPPEIERVPVWPTTDEDARWVWTPPEELVCASGTRGGGDR